MNTAINFEINEVASRCKINTQDILLYISYNWLLPQDPRNLLFDEDDISRILLICDLKVQFGVNDEGIPLILHLVDQLNLLHLKLSR